MKRLGILGTFVWDRIWTLADQEAGRPFETWGGMAYSLAAAAAARAEVRRRAFKSAQECCRIVSAELPGTAGGVGAAAVFKRETFGHV